MSLVMRRADLCWVLFLLIIMGACTSEAGLEEKLEGKWLVVGATRNDRETETLRDAFFEFSGDSILTTNILRAERAFPIEIKNNKVLQTGPIDITYDIVSVTEDTLIMEAIINTYSFSFRSIRDTSTQVTMDSSN